VAIGEPNTAVRKPKSREQHESSIATLAPLMILWQLYGFEATTDNPGQHDETL
jgi:hypothetical protein